MRKCGWRIEKSQDIYFKIEQEFIARVARRWWTDLSNYPKVYDLGTGTGILKFPTLELKFS